MPLRRAIEHYRRGGMDRLLSKVRDQLNYGYQYAMLGLERALLTDRQWYRYTVWRNQRGVDAAADPRELRYVAPQRIERSSPFETRFCFRKIGAVRGGDWDREADRLDDRFDYVWDALETRYEEGRDWEDVPLVREVATGERRWRFATGADVWPWVARLDEVYESIRTDGYRAQPDLLDASFEEAAHTEYDSLVDRFRPVVNESAFFGDRDEVSIFDWFADIQVDIGRDGEVIQHNGRHRLWFAKHLGLDEIPVRVIVRHEQWQAVRREIAHADSVAELSDRARRHLFHPDTVDVRGHLDLPEREEEPPAREREPLTA